MVLRGIKTFAARHGSRLPWNAGNRAHRRSWAAAPPKTLLILPDADHNDYELLAGDKMMQAIARFLRTLT